MEKVLKDMCRVYCKYAWASYHKICKSKKIEIDKKTNGANALRISKISNEEKRSEISEAIAAVYLHKKYTPS